MRARIFMWDLLKAYWQLWMDPGLIHLLGYMHQDEIYFNVTLSMGSKSAAYCCQHTTNSIKYIFNSFGFENVNYLDDPGAAEADGKAEEAYDCLGWILDSIAIKESRKKAKPPAYIAIFLGILFNTITMMLTLTEDRLHELRNLVKQWQQKCSAMLKEVQSLLGKLNFDCSTVRVGRIFISRIINAMAQFPDNGQ